MIEVKKFVGVELSKWEDKDYLARDTEVAKWLKFERPEAIRDLIRRNAKELNDYGFLRAVEENSADEKGRGRPATVYYLNKEQALIVAMLSRAPGAAEVRKILTRAFEAAHVVMTDSVIYNDLFLKAPRHTEYLWTADRLGPIARLYGVRYDGGRAPTETRRIQRIIYDLLLGDKNLKALREKYPDPPGTNGEPYIYDHFQAPVRTEFENHLDRTVVPFAGRASGAEDFLASMRHHYEGRPLQLSFFGAPRLKSCRVTKHLQAKKAVAKL